MKGNKAPLFALFLTGFLFNLGHQCSTQSPEEIFDENCCTTCCDQRSHPGRNSSNNESDPIINMVTTNPGVAKQSAFTAIKIGSKQKGDVGEVVIFHEVTTNINNHFSLASNVFTSRYTGVYVFMFSIGVGVNSHPIIRLVKNGQLVVSGGTVNSGNVNLGQGTNTAILDLQIGDQVWLQFAEYNGHSVYASEHKFTSFSGFLLYANGQ